jgi:methylation protein EvaC
VIACRVCGEEIRPFMSFGQMPIANGFLKPEEFDDEYFFELAPAFCDSCNMFQIIEQPDAQAMFHENYAFFSSTSKFMQAHFKEFAAHITETFLRDQSSPFVVELGSNDGIMLHKFAAAGIRHLGIEPSANVASVARQNGVDTISVFFGETTANEISDKHGKASAILAANVMCHIPNIHDVARGVRSLLADDGVFVFEDPYLGDMIEKTSYDQIYDEHVFVFSALSVSDAFARQGLELIDVAPQITHGGSMRYTLAPRGSRPVSPAVTALFESERALGLHRPGTYDSFRENCEASRDGLLALLQRLRDEGKRVVGYGATSKSTTTINYCGITPDHVEFISDTTPIKQGKCTPGAHIPVKPHDAFSQSPPDYTLLFAWNHQREIMANETEYTDAGGKWITYVPKVEIFP